MNAADLERLRQARREGNERRELNALVLMVVQGDFVIDLSRHGMARTGSGVVRNGGGYAWVSTLHRLEKKRQVERLRHHRFALAPAGLLRGLAERDRRRAEGLA